MPNPYELTRDQFAEFLADQPRFRVQQVMTGLYEHDLFPSEISTLPAPLRARLTDALPLSLSVAHEVATDDGDTVKWAFRLPDGATIETVLMKYRDRVTVCISTQAGCAMACSNCTVDSAKR